VPNQTTRQGSKSLDNDAPQHYISCRLLADGEGRGRGALAGSGWLHPSPCSHKGGLHCHAGVPTDAPESAATAIKSPRQGTTTLQAATAPAATYPVINCTAIRQKSPASPPPPPTHTHPHPHGATPTNARTHNRPPPQPPYGLARTKPSHKPQHIHHDVMYEPTQAKDNSHKHVPLHKFTTTNHPQRSEDRA
jgi:hypothetical protein